MTDEVTPLSGNAKRKMRSAARLYAVQALFQMEHSGQTVDAVMHEFEDHRFGASYDEGEMAEGGKALLATADIDGLAEDIEGLARDANHSLLETTGAVALGSMRGAGTIIKGGLIGAGATVKFVGKIVWDDVLGDYGRSIQKIYRRGFYGAVRGFLRPQARSIQALFRWRFLSWTELVLSLGQWGKAAWRL